MDTPSIGGRDSQFDLDNYEMPSLTNDNNCEIYNNDILHNRSTTLGTPLPRSNNLDESCSSGTQRGLKRCSDMCYDPNMMASDCSDIVDDSYTGSHSKGSPLSNGKKTKGRVKIKMEYIDNKLRRYTTFSKRKTGIMKKAYELSTLTGTQVMLLVASETGHVYTFATRKLQPMITSETGKALIQTCLNSPDPCPNGTGDQRMSATGFEETELSYNIGEEDKVRQLMYSNSPHSQPHQMAVHQNPQQQQQPHPHSHHAASSQHILGMSHPHAQSPPSHLIPTSSPSPMLASGTYQPHPSCSSSLYSHIQHSHPHR